MERANLAVKVGGKSHVDPMIYSWYNAITGAEGYNHHHGWAIERETMPLLPGMGRVGLAREEVKFCCDV